MEPDAPPALDPRALERLRVGLGKQADHMLPGLIDRFDRDTGRLLGQARQALAQAQAEDLRITAHSLKSTSATFAAMGLSSVGRELESLARDGRLDGAADLIAQAEVFLKVLTFGCTIHFHSQVLCHLPHQ